MQREENGRLDGQPADGSRDTFAFAASHAEAPLLDPFDFIVSAFA